MRNLQQLENEAPIIQYALDLYKELYEDLKKFPKKDQYLLGKRCEDNMLAFLEYILLASSASKDQKSRYLIIAAAKFDVLKVLLRVAKALKVLDIKQYISLQLKIQETGKMLGGWLRSLTIKTSV
jgi:four helix bundle protein